MAEEIYQQSLEIELGLRQIPFQSQTELVVSYKNTELQTKYKPDLFVFGTIIVELKAVSALLPEHEAQIFNYLRISRHPVGYLLNFGRKAELEWKRLILTELRGG